MASTNQPKEVVSMSEAEEPSSTSKEMDVQKRTGEGEENSQKRDEDTPLIIQITEENKHRVSKKDNGMLRALDGSLQRTPQYETWNENKHLQLRNDVDETPSMPIEIRQETPGHPMPAKVRQVWSYEGEWVMVPMYTSDQGSYLNDWRPGRIEPVIDMSGKLTKILSYGQGAEELTVWFWLKEIQKLFPEWRIPAPPKFLNSKRFMQPRGGTDPNTYRNNEVGEYYTTDYGYRSDRSQDRGRRDRNYNPGSDRDGRNGGRGQGYNR